ncbi:MAG: DnaJ domain-containing protein [Desulfovibrionales bacterium]|nr:DnaJ domain-containing protein [Desulfovibrionales bacterium]
MRLSECRALLEVPPDADLDEIKASYRKLAFKYHPDLHPGDTQAAQRFSRLNQAYVILKKNLDDTTDPSGKKVYDAETIRQEEEDKVKGGKPRRPSAFYARQEEVLKDILNDPFAKQVFEDIFSKLKRGVDPNEPRSGEGQGKTPGLQWERHPLSLDRGRSLVKALKDWAIRQLDDHQTVHMPARNLIPGTTLLVQIKHRFDPDPRSIEVTLPPDFVVGRPIRLTGQGRRIGQWRGDLYLRLLAR